MELTRDALLRVVKAARTADRLAQDMKKLLVDENRWTWADEIAGFLKDALFLISGEKLPTEADFEKDSKVVGLLRGFESDTMVASDIMKMAEENAPKMPKPNLMGQKEFQAMVKRYGGYSATPEGEWE